MKGDVVISADGEEVVLVDIGLVELLDTPVVRVWDVTLEPFGRHPWHLHHNPYLVLSLQGSNGRMDWLDGSPPRFISEYRGGAVYRPVSPVHRLTNLEDRIYQNRLVEFKDLGEHLPAPYDVGPGDRSVAGEPPGESLPDGRCPVLLHPHVRVWLHTLAPGEEATLELAEVEHVIADVDAPDLADDPTGGVFTHSGGPLTLTNPGAQPCDRFVVELSYRADLDTLLEGVRR